MKLHRRQWLSAAAGSSLSIAAPPLLAQEAAYAARQGELRITAMRVTPIALPDPPILAASGCHGPYFLRNIVEIETDAGMIGIAETHGGEKNTQVLLASRPHIIGKSAFAHRQIGHLLKDQPAACFAAIELACLDAIGRALGLRLCDLLGGPIRDKVEFASYLFFRYAADHSRVLDDPRLVDARGRGTKALDDYGDVRTPEAMAELARRFHQQWGFRVHKLKAGVLPPDVELEALRAINDRFGGQHPLRIDPNGRWSVETAVRAGRVLRELPLEYYEDPVLSQEEMAVVRRRTALPMSTNMCVTQFDHVPPAVKSEPIDVVLCDHHVWGGMLACQALATICDSLGWGLRNAGKITSVFGYNGASPPGGIAMQTHDARVERQMVNFYRSLSEKDRRRYAAVEAAKLGARRDRVPRGPVRL